MIKYPTEVLFQFTINVSRHIQLVLFLFSTFSLAAPMHVSLISYISWLISGQAVQRRFMFLLQFSYLFLFDKNMSPSASVVLENAALLFCCESTVMSGYCLNCQFWVNFSFNIII